MLYQTILISADNPPPAQGYTYAPHHSAQHHIIIRLQNGQHQQGLGRYNHLTQEWEINLTETTPKISLFDEPEVTMYRP